MDAVLARVAAVLPSGFEVIVLADRAYDVPAFIDRIAAYGWHWIIRCKANSSLCFLDHQGQEWRLRELLERHLTRPGSRWKVGGRIFKKAEWREASVVGIWGQSQKEPLVVLTDLPPKWLVLRLYDRRFWTEPGFRNDKKRGWQWESSQVQGVEHHQRLLLALAWASLVMLCLGVQAAQQRLAALSQRRVGKPEHARQSLFTLGLSRVRKWLYSAREHVLRWRLPHLDAHSWTHHWQLHQAYCLIFQTVRP